MASPRQINAWFLPDLVPAEVLERHFVVVIDVLRASTTILTALAHGAEAVLPCLTVDEARRRAAADPSSPLLGGERGGQRIPAFDLGNSPAEYEHSVVSGKRIYFTTTNGTRALHHASGAGEIVLAAFGNLSAVCERLALHSTVHILCAGTDGQITREDILLAGALVDDRQQAGAVECNDQALLAADAWRQAAAGISQGEPLSTTLRHSQGARNLMEIGHERDIEIAAQLDTADCLPIYNAADDEIRLR